MSDDIYKYIKRIHLIEKTVREFINTSRYQTNLLKDLDTWNQICSSLDTIGDTIYSIEDYINSDYPESTGLKYIYTYGLLQALFIQQGAMHDLSQAFEIEFPITEKLKFIREIRNASIGHPTRNNVKGDVYFNYISRMSLSKYGFSLMRSYDKGKTKFVEVKLLSNICEQLSEIEIGYNILANKLIEQDREHRMKYMNNLLVDLFHSSMGYMFSKVAEGIYSYNNKNDTFFVSMLESIEDTYHKFEEALSERNELNEELSYDLKEYKHALSKVRSYLTNNEQELKESDARIYHFYIKEQHNHFVKIANEIDEEYKQKA